MALTALEKTEALLAGYGITVDQKLSLEERINRAVEELVSINNILNATIAASEKMDSSRRIRKLERECARLANHSDRGLLHKVKQEIPANYATAGGIVNSVRTMKETLELFANRLQMTGVSPAVLHKLQQEVRDRVERGAVDQVAEIWPPQGEAASENTASENDFSDERERLVAKRAAERAERRKHAEKRFARRRVAASHGSLSKSKSVSANKMELERKSDGNSTS